LQSLRVCNYDTYNPFCNTFAIADKNSGKDKKNTAIVNTLENNGLENDVQSQEKPVQSCVQSLNNCETGDYKEACNRACNPLNNNIINNNKNNKNALARMREEIKIPEKLRTEDFLSAWDAWVQYLEIRHKTRNPITLQAQIKFLNAMGAEEAANALWYSMQNGWLKIIPDPGKEAEKNNNGFVSLEELGIKEG
jgi:hypothetical protein